MTADIIRAAIEQPKCRHCGRTITAITIADSHGWVAGVQFGKGQILCRPAMEAGNGRLHEPAEAITHRSPE